MFALSSVSGGNPFPQDRIKFDMGSQADTARTFELVLHFGQIQSHVAYINSRYSFS